MTDAVKMAIERIKARFHPHYGIDGASDSKQLASDCQTLITALEQAGEQVADENSEVLAVLAFAKARSWHHFGVAWDKLEKVSQDELVEQAAAFLIAPAPEAPLPTLQRLGQEFDAGEASEGLREAIAATEYKYFGDYEMSDAQRKAVDVLVDHARASLALKADNRSSMERLGDILRGSSFKPTQKYLGAAFLGYDYARRYYAHPPQSREPALTIADAWQDLVDKDDRTSPEEYPDMALITRDELADYMQSAQSRGQASDGEGEARADDIRRSIIRQLGDDPHADRIILPGTDWDIVLAALSSAKRGDDEG